MAKFKIKEATVELGDGQTAKVKELTQAERVSFFKRMEENKHDGPAFIVSLGSVDPKFTFEEASEEAGETIEKLMGKILELSGMKTEKKLDAGRALPMPGESGDGNASQPS